MYNIENVSLKIMRILYQLSMHSSQLKADINLLENRFSFTDQEKGLTVIKESIKSLKLLGFIETFQEQNKTLYKITPKGKEFYNQFKYLIDSPQTPNNIIIQGNWTGNNHNYHITQNATNSKEMFPGSSIEFMEHYKDIMKELEKLDILVYQEQKEEDIKEHLENIKNIINSNIENAEQKFPLISKLENISTKIEKQINHLNKRLSKEFSHS